MYHLVGDVAGEVGSARVWAAGMWELCHSAQFRCESKTAPKNSLLKKVPKLDSDDCCITLNDWKTTELWTVKGEFMLCELKLSFKIKNMFQEHYITGIKQPVPFGDCIVSLSLTPRSSSRWLLRSTPWYGRATVCPPIHLLKSMSCFFPVLAALNKSDVNIWVQVFK